MLFFFFFFWSQKMYVLARPLGVTQLTEHHPDTPRLGLDPRSGHIQEANIECKDKWVNKPMFSSLSLSPISKKKMHVLIYAFISQVAFQSSASEMHQYNLK